MVRQENLDGKLPLRFFSSRKKVESNLQFAQITKRVRQENLDRKAGHHINI